jgi:putative ABC transport system permease protein
VRRRGLRRAGARLLGVLTLRRKDGELSEEFASHLELLIEEYVRRGVPPDEARRLARIRFGNVENMKEHYRDQRGLPFVDMAYQDIRYGFRSFLRAPRFTVPAVIALALGVGATSAIFSVVRGVLLEPLPYQDPDRIVAVWENRLDRNRPRNVIGAANFVAWRERNKSFEKLGMVGPARLNIVLNGQPEEIHGFYASADALAAFGTQPQLGRLFTEQEDLEGTDGVIIISHQFWQNRLGGRADVLGQSITASGRPRSIVGVMPERFTIEGQPAAYMITYGWTVERLRQAQGRGSSHGIAKLRDGVSFEQAYDEMKTLMAQLAKEAPQRNTNWSITLVPIHEQTVDQIRPALYVLAGAVLLVLLIACVNVANLLLARSTVRQRELGVRTALGAARGRLLRQMVTESLLLSLIGGAAGLVLAAAFHRGLLLLVANRIPVPRLDQVTLDLTVVGFTMLLSIVSGLLFGVAPALFATRTVNDAIREGGRHGSGPRARRALGTLVVAEVALSLVLLAGAGLLLRSFMALQSVNPGMRTDGLLTARVSLFGERYSSEKAVGDFFTEATSRVSAIPGVESAAAVSFLPMAGLGIGTSFHRLDRPTPAPGEFPGTDVKPVTPNFFRTMGIPIRSGRDFTAADTLESPQVAIISDMLARQYFPNEDPIGKRLNVSIGRAQGGMNVEVVGVVADIKMTQLDAEIRPATYIPNTQLPIGLMTFVVRTSMEPTSLTSSVATAVRQVDPALPLADVMTMTEVVDATLARPRAVAALLAVFALLALVLAGVGVYGVMSYAVSQRTQEIGVRMALGATTQSVFRMMIGDALRLVTIGVVIGVVAAAWLSQFLTTMLFQTQRFDPWTFVGTAVVLTAVAAMASFVPARRGMRIAPVEALRTE